MARKAVEKVEEVAGVTVPKSFDFSFYNKIKTGDEFADKAKKIDTTTHFDTRCYALNALFTADVYKGFQGNKVHMFAGEQGCGKTMFTQKFAIKELVSQGYFIFWVDSENAVEYSDFPKIGIPLEGVRIIKENLVDNIRFRLTQILDTLYEAKAKGNDIKVAFVLDSQGFCDTMKNMNDSREGKSVQDMTKQKELKRMYSAVINRMGLLGAPFFITNHVYANIGGYGDPVAVSGGMAGKYAGSNIFLLTKAKESEGSGDKKVHKGTVFTVKVFKSRTVRLGLTVKIYFDFEKGLNPWYGLHKIAEEAGFLVKYNESHAAKGVVIPDGLGKGDKFVLIHPEKDPSEWVVCTNKTLHNKNTIGSILDPINKWVSTNFSYVSSEYDIDAEETEDDLDIAEEDSTES